MGDHSSSGAGGAGGGLFAEAGTPHGQAARAGLGGATSGGGGSAGGLYAGATAGGNVGAAAGLAGGVDAERSAGVGYAASSAGNHHASAGLGGEAGVAGSSGFTYSSSKSFGVSGGAVEAVKPVHKKVHTEFNFDGANEVNAVPLTNTNVHHQTEVIVETKTKPAVVVKEVYAEAPPPVIVEKHFIEPQPVIIEKHIIHPQPVVIEKHIHHKRPHHYRNKFHVHGYIGGAGDLPPPPAIEKRVDVGVESSANAGAYANAGAVANGGASQVTYTKQVNFQRNPQFFADIFNIPISTLKAVGSFLGNAAGSTSVSVQKSASVQAGAADSDSLSPEHGSPSSSQAHVSVRTPDATKLIDDIFAIPINTLGAVNKFLENNVSARKKVQVSADGVEEPTKFRLGPHARRRATKQVFVEAPKNTEKTEKGSE
ncbi:hypothetical protein MSG28_009639 [Choristoneura fumiferana]|uniref:Uncharacterized protein n=1 Tax=Choristoneura fumiferana TaxID=7141 RepID=A0ACC0JC37_CHOFU|nr:hypothetical protein MSG28_009639 [Choristoneura fumiferana]